jgi:hypothetical protein
MLMFSATPSAVDDIEDIVAKGTSADDIRHTAGYTQVVPRPKRLTKTERTKVVKADSFIPGAYI